MILRIIILVAALFALNVGFGGWVLQQLDEQFSRQAAVDTQLQTNSIASLLRTHRINLPKGELSESLPPYQYFYGSPLTMTVVTAKTFRNSPFEFLVDSQGRPYSDNTSLQLNHTNETLARLPKPASKPKVQIFGGPQPKTEEDEEFHQLWRDGGIITSPEMTHPYSYVGVAPINKETWLVVQKHWVNVHPLWVKTSVWTLLGIIAVYVTSSLISLAWVQHGFKTMHPVSESKSHRQRRRWALALLGNGLIVGLIVGTYGALEIRKVDLNELIRYCDLSDGIAAILIIGLVTILATMLIERIRHPQKVGIFGAIFNLIQPYSPSAESVKHSKPRELLISKQQHAKVPPKL